MEAVLRRSSSARPSSAASRSCWGELGSSWVARCGRLVIVVLVLVVVVMAAAVVVVVVAEWCECVCACVRACVRVCVRARACVLCFPCATPAHECVEGQ